MQELTQRVSGVRAAIARELTRAPASQQRSGFTLQVCGASERVCARQAIKQHRAGTYCVAPTAAMPDLGHDSAAARRPVDGRREIGGGNKRFRKRSWLFPFLEENPPLVRTTRREQMLKDRFAMTYRIGSSGAPLPFAPMNTETPAGHEAETVSSSSFLQQFLIVEADVTDWQLRLAIQQSRSAPRISEMPVGQRRA